MALRINPRLGAFANTMRREPTPFEHKLWQRLRSSQLGFKFRRQIVLGGAIVDFFCPSVGLIVEIGGETHDADSDRLRDHGMAQQGFRTLRLTNAQVRDDMEGVLTAILDAARVSPPRFTHPPTPSLEREGER